MYEICAVLEQESGTEAGLVLPEILSVAGLDLKVKVMTG